MEGKSSSSHIGEALRSMTYLAMGLSSYSMTGRPVPAPRPSRSNTDKALSHQSRSCSVPPNTRHMWLNAGRELNVDDGMSIRSESTQSLVSFNHRCKHNTYGFNILSCYQNSECIIHLYLALGSVIT